MLTSGYILILGFICFEMFIFGMVLFVRFYMFLLNLPLQSMLFMWLNWRLCIVLVLCIVLLTCWVPIIIFFGLFNFDVCAFCCYYLVCLTCVCFLVLFFGVACFEMFISGMVLFSMVFLLLLVVLDGQLA